MVHWTIEHIPCIQLWAFSRKVNCGWWAHLMVDERRRRDEFGRKREGKINSAGEKEGRESDSLRPSILFVFLAFIESYYCHFSFPPLLSFFCGNCRNGRCGGEKSGRSNRESGRHAKLAWKRIREREPEPEIERRERVSRRIGKVPRNFALIETIIWAGGWQLERK